MEELIKKDSLLSFVPFSRTLSDSNPANDYERGYKDCWEEAIQVLSNVHTYKVNPVTLAHVSFRGALTPSMAVEMKNKPVYLVDVDDPENNGWGIVTMDRYNILVNGKALTSSQYLFYDVPTNEEIQLAVECDDLPF